MESPLGPFLEKALQGFRHSHHQLNQVVPLWTEPCCCCTSGELFSFQTWVCPHMRNQSVKSWKHFVKTIVRLLFFLVTLLINRAHCCLIFISYTDCTHFSDNGFNHHLSSSSCYLFPLSLSLYYVRGIS